MAVGAATNALAEADKKTKVVVVAAATATNSPVSTRFYTCFILMLKD